MRRGIVGVVPIAALAAWVIVSCLEPTEINVLLTTNFTCANVDVIVLAGGAEVTTKTGPPFSATTSACKSAHEIGNLYVVPSAKPGAVYVRVVAGVLGSKASDCLDPMHPTSVKCIEAKRSLRFVSHRKLDLPIALDEACINKMCPMGQTCDRGECVNENVCTENCSDAGDTDSGMDPDTGVDTGADAGPPVQALMIAAGFDNACAYADNKKLYCWGDNSGFQLGTTNSNTGVLKIDMPALGGITEIAVGNHFICANDGSTVQCIGDDAIGQLGDGMTSTKSSSAITAFTGSGLDSLTAGDGYACVHDPMGKQIVCWGVDGVGTDYIMQGSLSGDPGLELMVAGAHHACGRDAMAQTYCWGTNNFGEVAVNPQATMLVKSPAPVMVPLGKFSGLYAGHEHSAITVGVSMLKHTYGWGENTFGEIDAMLVSSAVWTPTDLKLSADSLAFGLHHVCGVELAKLYCRGDNAAGQVTGIVGGQYKAWQTITLGDTVATVAAGSFATCALTTTNRVFCWGKQPIGTINMKPTEIFLPP